MTYDIKKFLESIEECPSMELGAVMAFMEEMGEARYSDYYTEARREVFGSINWAGIESFVGRSASNSRRVGKMKSGLTSARQIASSANVYF